MNEESRPSWFLRALLVLGSPVMLVADAVGVFALCVVAQRLVQSSQGGSWGALIWTSGPWAAGVVAAMMALWAWAVGESARRGSRGLAAFFAAVLWIAGGAFGLHRIFSGQWRSGLAMALAWTAGAFFGMDAAGMAISMSSRAGPVPAFHLGSVPLPVEVAVPAAAALALMLSASLCALRDGLRLGASKG